MTFCYSILLVLWWCDIFLFHIFHGLSPFNKTNDAFTVVAQFVALGLKIWVACDIDSLSLLSWLPDGYSQILRLYVFGPSGFWTMAPLRCASKFDPFLTLDWARVWGRTPRKGRDQILPSGNLGSSIRGIRNPDAFCQIHCRFVHMPCLHGCTKNMLS